MGFESLSPKKQNLHTHTTYSDGKLTAEEMILAAIEKGCDSLGFSEHSYVPYIDDLYSMSPEKTAEYIDELTGLKNKYIDDIEIFIGLELDYLTAWRPDKGLDYILGTVHNLKIKDESGVYQYPPIDGPLEMLTNLVDMHFDGDYYSAIEAYYKTLTDIVNIADVDIIAHFDLITKNNYNNSLFDEQHPRYQNAALGAMDALLEKCKIFEVNTGAMYRINKPEPYPSKFLLKELFKRGGEVILGSDSHDGNSLCYAFEDLSELLKSCGYKYQKRLTKNGFIDVEL